MKIHHLNCVKIESSLGLFIGHCILLEDNKNLILIDAGVGLMEMIKPDKILKEKSYKLDEDLTAIRQIEKLGLDPRNVKNIVCSHLDHDHIGGLVDFPNAKIHVSKEEYEDFKKGNKRYWTQQLSHKPEIQQYDKNDSEWFGLPTRKLNLNVDIELFLIPLFGHTRGHCGVVFKQNDKWIFYVGDAFFLEPKSQTKIIQLTNWQLWLQLIMNYEMKV